MFSAAQIEQYLENDQEKTIEQVPKAEAYLIGIAFTTEIFGFEVKEDEAIQYNRMILLPLSKCLKKEFALIDKSKLETIRDLAVPVVVASLQSYQTHSASLEQKEGEITVIFHFFNNPNEQKPYKSLKLTARGEKHWGNSTPLENSIKELAVELKHSCNKK
jgi:hypothetical protein